MRNNIYNPFRNKQEDSPEAHCIRCQEGIYYYDYCYQIDNEAVCEFCADDKEKDCYLAIYAYKLFGGNYY